MTSVLLSLPNDVGLGEALGSILRVQHFRAYTKKFPDGEVYLRVPEEVFNAGKVLIIQSLYPDQNTNLLFLLLAVDLLKSKGVKYVSAFVPYLAYARQDREFLMGEAVSVRTVLRLLNSVGLDALITVDIHKEDSLKFFGKKARNLILFDVLASAVRGQVEEPLVVAPDIGASRRAEATAKSLGCRHVIIRKVRDRVTGEVRHELPEGLPVEGVDVIIADDIISTGGTVANIATYLKSRGARKVFVVASHGLFVGEALSKLRSSGIDKVFVLRTVPPRAIGEGFIEYVDLATPVAGYLANELR